MRLFAAIYLDLLKALIQVKAHTRKDGTQVRAHTRNIQSRAERKELVAALARKMADGARTRHATLASAVGAARYASKVNGKAVHVYEHPEGGWVATHDETHTEGHPEKIVALKGRARLHRAGEASRSLAHLKGPILEHVEKPAPAPKVKPARPKREKQPEPVATPEPAANDAEGLRAQAEALGIRLSAVEKRALANGNRVVMGWLRKQIEKRQGKPAAPKPAPVAPEVEQVAPEPDAPKPEEKPAERKPRAEKPKAPAPEKAADAEPKGPRGEREYEDVGEKIGGARKDLAAAFARGEKSFENIDWSEMQELPETAAKVIIKANLIGHLTPEHLKSLGMDARAAYMLDHILGTIVRAPKDSNLERYRYARALDRIARAVRNVKTLDDLHGMLRDMHDEAAGVYGDAEDLAPLQLLQAKKAVVSKRIQDLYAAGIHPSGDNAELNNLLAERNNLWDEMSTQLDKVRAKSRSTPHPWGACYGALGANFAKGLDKLGYQVSDFGIPSDTKTIMNLPRGTYKTSWSDALSKARGMKADDWSWSEKASEGSTAPKEKAAKGAKPTGEIRLPDWKRKTPEQYERTGGKTVDFGALSKDGKIKPEGIMQAFKLRGVEYGNWVTQAEAAHHTQRAGEALQDLATILGVTPEHVSYGGRLALAFGARGSGKALAHYESERKVINLTKHAGGGTLAHEWAHFLDNIVANVSQPTTGEVQDATRYMSHWDEKGVPGQAHPRVAQAIAGVLKAMHEGGVPQLESVKPPKNPAPLYYRYADLDQFVAEHGPQEGFNKYIEGKRQTARWQMRTSTVRDYAKYVAAKTGTIIHYDVGTQNSDFYTTAITQDMGSPKYWATPHEMFARAFEAYVQDKGAEKGITNNYLVDGTRVPSDLTYRHPTAGERPFAVYPVGEERKRINAAMDDLMAALRETDTLKKALALAGPSSGMLFRRWW
jgi:hypothetical protein